MAATSAASREGGEKTFRNYKAGDAAKYAAARGAYPQALIDIVLDAHKSTGGKFDSLIDVGCGPGQASRQVAIHFKHAVAADPSVQMIEHARGSPSNTDAGTAIDFQVCSAEEIDRLAEPNSVDLITAATAAHWFHYPEFYVAAAKVLKPGGSIICWTSGRAYPDPKTTPNSELVRQRGKEWEEKTIRPYEMPGNVWARELYARLPLPWTSQSEDPAVKAAVADFDEAASIRMTFNEDGEPDERFENGFIRYINKAPIEMLKQLMATASPVTRWREAHKEQLEKGEIEDCIESAFRGMAEAMGTTLGPGGVTELSFCQEMAVVVIKKKSVA